MQKPMVKLDLVSREDFAELSLKEKNTYLLNLAERFYNEAGLEPVHLPEQAIARLRRFYSRRALGDLGLDTIVDSPIKRALEALGRTIKNEGLMKDLSAALLIEVKNDVTRTPPADDAQMSFFVPTVYDAPIKDDVNLMDFAPFSLSRHKRTGSIVYELKDSIIQIDGSAEHGIASIFDYDIFLHMVSSLTYEYQRYCQDIKKGLRPELPAKVYRPSTSHILKFCRRSTGGKAYKDLEAALDRLGATRIKVVNLDGGTRREVQNIPLIQNYRVVSKTSTGNIDVVEITIPDWVYDNIVRSKDNPHILTINPDYFIISHALGKMIYRLARRAAGRATAKYGLTELHKRSGSPQPRAQFLQTLKRFVENCQNYPLPEYDLKLLDGRSEPILIMSYRDPNAIAAPVNEEPVQLALTG